MPLVSLWLSVAALLACGAGCHRRPHTPQEAYARLEHAVAAGDAAELHDLLDKPTRDAIDSVFHDEQLERTIITARYPAAEARTALAKLEAAAEPDAVAYFVKRARAERRVEGFRKRLGSVSGPIEERADGSDAAYVARKDGMPFRFHRDSDGSWGFGELAAEWALERDRASHAVRTVRENAKLFDGARP